MDDLDAVAIGDTHRDDVDTLGDGSEVRRLDPRGGTLMVRARRRAYFVEIRPLMVAFARAKSARVAQIG